MEPSLSSMAANVIKVLHFGLVIFILAVPFMDIDWKYYAFHAVLCISLLVHWWMNNDTCVLTLIESALTNVPERESFMYRLVSPVYKIKDNDLKHLVRVVVPILFAISARKIYLKLPQVKQDYNLFRTAFMSPSSLMK